MRNSLVCAERINGHINVHIKSCSKFIAWPPEARMHTAINLGDDLLAEPSMPTGVTYRTPLTGESLKAIIARESDRRLTLLGRFMPDFEVPLRRRPAVDPARDWPDKTSYQFSSWPVSSHSGWAHGCWLTPRPASSSSVLARRRCLNCVERGGY